MPKRIYKLSFITPVRFGMMSDTASLSCLYADTLFSALYLTLQETGQEQSFLRYVQDGSIRFSDGMPFKGNMLYLPRPVGIYPAGSEADTDPSVRKLLKKIRWLPLNGFDSWLEGKLAADQLLVQFGEPFERTRVNRRDAVPMPYQVEGFRFADDCGLYVIAEAETEEADSLLSEGMSLLQASGIGGLRSSGWGKFILSAEPVPEILLQKLNNPGSGYQMLLNVAFPTAQEAEETMKEANYILVRRGGYTAGKNETTSLKQMVWLLGAGSTFNCRFSGDVLDVSTSSSHPVWRYAKAMMMGVCS